MRLYLFTVSWGRGGGGVQAQTKKEHVQHFFNQTALSQKLKVRGGRGKSIHFVKVMLGGFSCQLDDKNTWN